MSMYRRQNKSSQSSSNAALTFAHTPCKNKISISALINYMCASPFDSHIALHNLQMLSYSLCEQNNISCRQKSPFHPFAYYHRMDENKNGRKGAYSDIIYEIKIICNGNKDHPPVRHFSSNIALISCYIFLFIPLLSAVSLLCETSYMIYYYEIFRILFFIFAYLLEFHTYIAFIIRVFLFLLLFSGPTLTQMYDMYAIFVCVCVSLTSTA